eukprot:Tbor_TRINITY_DN2796_c0_g1::TRINITY_DN2796_c0_g1_i1::g.15263::m.15263
MPQSDVANDIDRIKAMYAKYAPDKTASMEKALEKYKGHENELLNALIKKYGPEPTEEFRGDSLSPSSPVANSISNDIDRIKAMYAKYAPDKTAAMEKALEKYKGHENELLNALIKKYGPEPTEEFRGDSLSPSSPVANSISNDIDRIK